MKYFGLAGLILMVITLAIGWKVLAPGNQPAPHEHSTLPAGSAADTAAIDRDFARTQQLTASLDAIAARAFERHDDGALIAFTRGNANNPLLPASSLDADGNPVEYARVVSMLYSGRGFNRAVVDGKYVRTGARLPDGARVVNITSDTVVIKSADGRKVLRVPDQRNIAPAADGEKK